MDFSSVSGSMPWDIERFPCGSMSTHSTRCPCSANAAARLRVVVVFATPPFWLAKAMIRACLGSLERRKTDTGAYSHARGLFLHSRAIASAPDDQPLGRRAMEDP